MGGQYAGQLGNLGSVLRLDVNGNSLNGGIPSELGKLVQLGRLNLESNHFQGSVPQELGNLGANKDSVAIHSFLFCQANVDFDF